MVRRQILTFNLIFVALAVAGCAPMSAKEDFASGSTGYQNADQVPYVHGDDPRLNEELENDAKKQVPAEPSSPQKRSPLKERLREFQIARFNEGPSQNNPRPSRFGKNSISIKVFFKDEATKVFSGPLTGSAPNLTFSAKAADYELSGTLTDSEPQKSVGRFTLKKVKSSDEAVILYRAYKATLNVREDNSNPVDPQSKFADQLKNLKENTFAWVHNWAVVRGVAFYLIDVVRVIPLGGDTQISPPIFSIQGESLRTGEADKEAPAAKASGSTNIGTPSETKLIGNGEEESVKVFSVKMADPETKTQREVMVDVEIEPVQTAGDPRQQSPDERPALPPVDPRDQRATDPREQARPPEHSPAVPTPAPIDRSNTVEPVTSGDSYLKITTDQRRTSRMAKDFARNRNLKSVKDWIAAYQNQNKGWGRDLVRFYKFANPFRRMIEAIGRTYDVSPAYAYLTVIESKYFTGGRYFNKDNSGVALGPFQFKRATARSVNMFADGSARDERYYFAPSACGAAKYVAELVDQFDDGKGDTTMAILGYNQGSAGASAAAYCTLQFEDDQAARACARRINNGMKSAEYNKAIRYVKNFNYTYAQLDRAAAIPKAMRDYVTRKLAIYFISNDMQEFGFAIPRDAPRSLPTNNSVMPPQAIQDAKCRQVVSR